MSIGVLAGTCYAAATIAFIRYALGRAAAGGPAGGSIMSRLDRGSLVRLRRFHLWAAWCALAAGIILTMVGVAR